jgi:hypothetical protein
MGSKVSPEEQRRPNTLRRSLDADREARAAVMAKLIESRVAGHQDKVGWTPHGIRCVALLLAATPHVLWDLWLKVAQLNVPA